MNEEIIPEQGKDGGYNLTKTFKNLPEDRGEASRVAHVFDDLGIPNSLDTDFKQGETTVSVNINPESPYNPPEERPDKPRGPSKQ